MTLDLQKLLAVKTIVTHAACPDGVASAMILKSILPNAEVLAIHYNSPEQTNLKATEGMLFCDFTPPPERVTEFVEAGALVLDHHIKQKAVVDAFGSNGVFADEKLEPGISGAMLAYREVWLPIVKNKPQGYLQGAVRATYDNWQIHLSNTRNLVANKLTSDRLGKVAGFEVETDPQVVSALSQIDNLVTSSYLSKFIEDFATTVGIRDTWQKSSPLWQKSCELSAVLKYLDLSDWLTAPIFPPQGEDLTWNFRMGLGKTLFNQQLKNDKRSASEVLITHAGPYKVAILQGIGISDLADLLDKDIDVVAGFRYSTGTVPEWPTDQTDGPTLIWSLRSRTNFDVGAFAVKQPGGGGHSAAAGFTVKVAPTDPNPYVYILNLLTEFAKPVV